MTARAMITSTHCSGQLFVGALGSSSVKQSIAIKQDERPRTSNWAITGSRAIENDDMPSDEMADVALKTATGLSAGCREDERRQEFQSSAMSFFVSSLGMRRSSAQRSIPSRSSTDIL